MKPTKSLGKLSLKKKTVANLNNRQMKELLGGLDTKLDCWTNFTFRCSECLTCQKPCVP